MQILYCAEHWVMFGNPFSPLSIDVSPISRDSKTAFWGDFVFLETIKNTFSIAKLPILFRISHPCRGLRRVPSIRYSAKVPTENRPNATKNRPDATENRPDATILCHFETLLRHFAHVANSDLRPIAIRTLDRLQSRGCAGIPNSDGNREIGMATALTDLCCCHPFHRQEFSDGR